MLRGLPAWGLEPNKHHQTNISQQDIKFSVLCFISKNRLNCAAITYTQVRVLPYSMNQSILRRENQKGFLFWYSTVSSTSTGCTGSWPPMVWRVVTVHRTRVFTNTNSSLNNCAITPLNIRSYSLKTTAIFTIIFPTFNANNCA